MYSILVTSTSHSKRTPIQYTLTNRFEKLEHLLVTCSSTHISDSPFLRVLVAWMSEDEFDEFYARYCSLWQIESIDGDEKDDNEH